MSGAEYYKRKCAEATSGRGVVPPPSVTSLEGCYLAGAWIYRVEAEGGIPVYPAPTPTMPCGHYAHGDFVRGIELRGNWLKLDPPTPCGPISHARAKAMKSDQWIELVHDDGSAPVSRVLVVDPNSHTLEGEQQEDTDAEAAEPSITRRSGLAGELLDLPFVPCLEADDASTCLTPAATVGPVGTVDVEDGVIFYDAPSEVEAEDRGDDEARFLSEAASAALMAGTAIPVGTSVCLHRLQDTLAIYNGLRGVVVTARTTDHVGVLLGTPFAGTRIDVLSNNVEFSAPIGVGHGHSVAEELTAHASVLGLTLAELGLSNSTEPASSPAVFCGFRLSGNACCPRDCLAAAMRSAKRDSLGDMANGKPSNVSSLWTRLQTAHDILAAAIRDRLGVDDWAAAWVGSEAAASTSVLAPDVRVRNGALGRRAAAAAAAAINSASNRETQRGIGELKALLLAELDREVHEAEPQRSQDALRLRLTLCLAHLESGASTAAAVEQAREAHDAHAHSPAAALVYARCLLRSGRRAEALKLLHAAAYEGLSECADAAWAQQAAVLMLRAMRATELRQELALKLYEKGKFCEAAAAFVDAVSCTMAGASDDTHRRAALHANLAVCYRRSKQPDAGVRECDKALALLPRYARALFRRAVCLLEGAKPDEAVTMFEQLYRIDRSWPRLSDWLLRAHAAVRRRAGASGESSACPKGSGRSRDDVHEADEAADSISRESDHYIVLGVRAHVFAPSVSSA